MLIFSLVFLCASLLVIQYARSRNTTSPPGPSLLEILLEWIKGKRDISQAFEAWNNKYGPIVRVKVGAKTVIILGTRQAAQDLLERRAATYSSRGPSVFLDKYLHRGLASAFMPYGSQWRLHRRLHSSLINISVSKTYQGLQDVKSRYLMRDFLSLSDYSDLFYRYTSSVMFVLAYGGDDDGNEDECDRHKRLHQINEMATFILQNASGGTLWLDLFPLLDRLPTRLCMRWREKARELHEQTKRVYIECANTALKSHAGNRWNWSIEANAQKMKGDDGLAWDEMCYSIGELYVAGIHTTKMVLELFVKACIEHSEAMKKAQNELDTVVGVGRLPSFNDADNLPYINAFISELLRRRPISPLGVPHMVTQDDTYMGYQIPAGSIVVSDQLAMNMDGTIFDKPETFDPDRYIRNADLPSPSTFGFGRRQCPGHHIARANLFVVISRMLWGYDIQPQKIDTKVSSAEKVSIRIRSPEHKQTIENEWAKAKDDEIAFFESFRPAKKA